jgi:drug/metabolite transporter (DMT)-like permease
MTRRGWLLFSAMSIIWGIPYLLIRVAVRHLDPGVLVLGRTGPAALLLIPLVIGRGQVGVLLKNLKWIAVFGVVEFGRKAHHEFTDQSFGVRGSPLLGGRPANAPRQ